MASSMNVVQDVHAEGIPVSDIRKALNHEWGELSGHIRKQTGSPPLRASTSTLVVMTRAGADLRRARETLHQLASAVPSRAILFILDESRNTPIANVWAHCSIGARGKHGACYDVIEIEMPLDRLDAIPNIIAVHRLGELPTFVVWDGPADIESREFRNVARLTDRYIIDTERFDEPLAALERYAMFLGTAGSTVIGSDLAWTRLSTWRELTSRGISAAWT
jgi:glucose-6-phosphate dehydrogenase assembly protein OpcA